MVLRDRGDAAPIVDPGIYQLAEAFVVEVGRGLHGNLCGQHDARGRDGAQEIRLACLGRAGHLRAGLGAEILDDDFLQVPMAQVQITQRE